MQHDVTAERHHSLRRWPAVHASTWRARATATSATFLAVAVLTLGVAGTAAAQIVGDPNGLVQVGTEAGDNPTGVVAISNGGCANGAVAVANGGCTPNGWVAVGLNGAGARGDVAIADRGNAHNYSCSLVCFPPHVAVTGGGGDAGCWDWTMAAVNLGDGNACAGTLAFANNGSARNATLAVSNSGNAAGHASVSVTGTAGRSDPAYGEDTTTCYGGPTDVSLSLTADACTEHGVAVAPNGDAYGQGGAITVGTGEAKRTVNNGPEGVGGTDTFVHTGLNVVEDAYQAAVVATGPAPDPVDVAEKAAWAADVVPCVHALLVAHALDPAPTEPGSEPPSGSQCLPDAPSPPPAPGMQTAAASWTFPVNATIWNVVLEPGYKDGCVPQMAKAVYYTNSMPSQKRLYDEMGTKRNGGTTFSTAAKIIGRYYQGESIPIADVADDADTVMNRVVSMLLRAYQGTILALDPTVSHWKRKPPRTVAPSHAVATWGYFLGGGGYLWVVDGYDNPGWGSDNPYGYWHLISLLDVFAAMQAHTQSNSGVMIW